MRRLIFVISFLFISVIFVNASEFTGLYIAPKIDFYPEKHPTGKAYDYYAGGGVSLGFDFFRLKTQVPVRLELEYLGRLNFSEMRTSMHSLMVGVYYDLNLFYVNANEYDTLTTYGLYTTKRPFMSFYVGASFGGRFENTVTGTTNESKLVSTVINKSSTSFAFGANAGFAIHFTSYFTFDLGYRFVIGPGFKSADEVLASFRFTMP